MSIKRLILGTTLVFHARATLFDDLGPAGFTTNNQAVASSGVSSWKALDARGDWLYCGRGTSGGVEI